MISNLKHCSSTSELLAHLLRPDAHGVRPPVIVLRAGNVAVPPPPTTTPTAALADFLDAPARRFDGDGRAGLRHRTWHCNLQTSVGQRIWDDEEWVYASERAMLAALNESGEELGCRWTAIRRSERSVDLVTNLIRQDGLTAFWQGDAMKIRKACAGIRREIAEARARDRTSTRVQLSAVPYAA